MDIREFPKIESLFNRGPDHKVIVGEIRCPEFKQIKNWLVTEKVDGTNIRVSLEGSPVFQEVTTYDAMNLPSTGVKQIALSWAVKFYGRTSAAQIPTHLLSYLQDTFTLERMARLWRGKQGCEFCGGGGQIDVTSFGNPPHSEWVQCGCVERYPIVLFGEGYGPKIRKGGGNYRADPSFRLFDVLVNDKWWLDWSAVGDVAETLEIKTVPELGHGDTIEEITDYVRGGIWSRVAYGDCGRDDVLAEGVVARTDPYLYDKHGRPLRFKLKTRDFPGVES